MCLHRTFRSIVEVRCYYSEQSPSIIRDLKPITHHRGLLPGSKVGKKASGVSWGRYPCNLSLRSVCTAGRSTYQPTNRQTRRKEKGTHSVLLSLDGKESVTHIFPRATLNCGKPCQGSMGERSRRALSFNLYGHRGVTANDFFTTCIMGSDNPTDGG